MWLLRILTIFGVVWTGVAQSQWSSQFGQLPEINISAFAPTPQGFVAAGSPVSVLNDTGTIEFHVLRFYENGSWRTAGDIGVGVVQGGFITTIVPYREDVCVGGGFTNFSAGNFNYFACYSTSAEQWYQPGGNGNGPNLPVNSVWFDGALNLYIGGDFTEVSDAQGMPLTANRIARTTGTQWETLTGDGGATNGVNSSVQVVRTFNGFVFVAHGSNLSRFNPTTETWTPYGQGTTGVSPRVIVDIAFFDNEVVVSGPFSAMGGIDAPGTATSPISGSAPDWMPLDDGSQDVGSGLPMMAANSSYIYVTGAWPTLTGADGLARWTGMVWEAVDTARLGDSVFSALVDVAVLGNTDICVRHQGFINSDLASRTVACKQEPVGPWRGTSQGIEALVRGPSALAEYAGELYAAGDFASAGDVAQVGSIASWNGQQWADVGGGVTGAVQSLATFQGELFAAGTITAAGGNASGGLVAWNGTQWRDAGGQTTAASFVYPLNNSLYFFGVGGNCGNFLSRLCRFDGNTIEEAANGLPEPVTVDAIGEFNGQLVVAGNFAFTGGARQNVIAALDGGAWNVLVTSAAGGRTRALASDDTYLYFAGDFTTNVAGAPAALNGVGRWDGNEITPLGSGLSGAAMAEALEVRGSELFVTGFFDSAGGTPASGIARWDGASWAGIGAGLQRNGLAGTGNALLSTAAGLYVTGDFNRTGDQWAENIGLLLSDVVYANGFEEP